MKNPKFETLEILNKLKIINVNKSKTTIAFKLGRSVTSTQAAEASQDWQNGRSIRLLDFPAVAGCEGI